MGSPSRPAPLVIGVDGQHSKWTGTHNHHHGTYGKPGTFGQFHSHEHEHGASGDPDASHGHHAQAEPDLADSIISALRAMYAETRTARMERVAARHQAMMARSEGSYGSLQSVLARAADGGSGLLARASFNVWPDEGTEGGFR